VEPEAALRRANEKFTARFDAVEKAFTSRGQSLSGASLDQMETEWQKVKAVERP
jgi:ATP diphosphatase